MNNHQQQIMDSTQFIERLKELGITISMDELRRWSKQELIPSYKAHYQPRRKKRGRPSNTAKVEKEGRIIKKASLGLVSEWPEKALEEAAAVWAVRHNNSDVKRDDIKVTPRRIRVIKRAAAIVYKSPFAVYTLPSVTGPLSKQHISPQRIRMKFVSEDFDGIDLFPGKDGVKKSELLSSLVVTWVAAIEKVRQWNYDGINAQIMKDKNLKRLTPAEIDFSQFDPWRITVACPWRIDRPARVELFWWSQPSKNGGAFYRWPFRWQRSLSESKRDEIVLYENGVDPREFFTIDIGDRQGWARAELKTIKRAIEENARTLRRVGIATRGERLPVTSERYDTLPPEEKNAVDEWAGLRWRRAQLKRQFGV